MHIEGKPDFEKSMQRIEAWFAGEMLDRPPVRFTEHNADFAAARALGGRTWPTLRDKWFDAEFQVDYFLASIKGRRFYGETFPVFWPNLGPNIYAAFHGADLDFGEVTSWVRHMVKEDSDLAKLKFDKTNAYFQGIEKLTRAGLDRCEGKFMVGYTDLHGSLDCVADWRDPQGLCFDLIEAPDRVHAMLRIANENFLPLFDHYDCILKAQGQLSATWMAIPSRGKFHVSSCDFTTMVSTAHFDEFYLPSLQRELKHMTHNVFHVDGKGMLRHLDRLLEQPEIHAIQWVQGVGDDLPILQWMSVIRKIRAAGKGVVVDLHIEELEPFMSEIGPEGLFLCIAVEERLQPEVLKKLEAWRGEAKVSFSR